MQAMPETQETQVPDTYRRHNPWVGKIRWRRAWEPTPVFLPRECHGQRNLAGYSPWGRKESDTTEQLKSGSAAYEPWAGCFVTDCFL